MCCIFCQQRGHGADTKFRLGINIDSGKAHCFHCHWKTRDIYALLEATTGNKVRKPDNYEKGDAVTPKPELPDDFQLFFGISSPGGVLRDRALKYLYGRGLSRDQIEYHRVGYCTTGRHAYRVVFPVYKAGELVTFIARDFTGKQSIKFLNQRGEKPLWATKDISRTSPDCTVVLYEGIFKALAGERANPMLANPMADAMIHAATLGSQTTTLQLGQLDVQEVVLFPDPDKPGRRGYLKVGTMLLERQCARVTVAWPPPTAEADEMSAEDIRSLIENRKSFYEVRWQLAKQVIGEDE